MSVSETSVGRREVVRRGRHMYHSQSCTFSASVGGGPLSSAPRVATLIQSTVVEWGVRTNKQQKKVPSGLLSSRIPRHTWTVTITGRTCPVTGVRSFRLATSILAVLVVPLLGTPERVSTSLPHYDGAHILHLSRESRRDAGARGTGLSRGSQLCCGGWRKTDSTCRASSRTPLTPDRISAPPTCWQLTFSRDRCTRGPCYRRLPHPPSLSRTL